MACTSRSWAAAAVRTRSDRVRRPRRRVHRRRPPGVLLTHLPSDPGQPARLGFPQRAQPVQQRGDRVVVRPEIHRRGRRQLAQRRDPTGGQRPPDAVVEDLAQVASDHRVAQQRGRALGVRILLRVAAVAVPGPGHHVVPHTAQQRVQCADRRAFDERERGGRVLGLRDLAQRRHPFGRLVDRDPQRSAYSLVRQVRGEHREVFSARDTTRGAGPPRSRNRRRSG